MRIVLVMVIAALVAGCVSDGGQAGTSDGLSAESSIERTRRLIDEAHAYDLPAGNYRIEVERLWLREADASAIGAIVGYDDNTTAVRVGRPVRDPGFTVTVGGGKFRTALSGTLSRTSGSERTAASILTVADAPAYLDIGTTRPATAVTLGRGGPTIVQGGTFVGTSLEAVVSPAGPGQVTLQLTPRFSSPDGRGNAIRVAEMSTTVRVPLDRPVIISSNDQAQDGVTTTLLSRSAQSGREEAVIILTVTGG